MDERNIEQDFGCTGKNPAYCMTCANADGMPPWADGPLKSYCLAYPREDGMRKPPSVYYEGAECDFYRRAR